MKFRFLISALLLLVLQTGFSQSQMEMATKEYELFAYERAIKTYLKAIQSEGYSSDVLANLADAYAHLNNMKEAKKWYEKATALDEIPQQHILNYGKVLMALKDYDGAKEWFTVYATKDPVIGKHYIEKCDFAKAGINDAPTYQVAALSSNTSGSDFGAHLMGDKLIFASTRGDIQKDKMDKTWTGDNKNRLFVGLTDGKGVPQSIRLLHSELKNAFNEGPIAISPDGKTVAITKNHFIEGTRQIPSSGGQMSIFIAERDANGDWTDAKAFIHNTIDASTGYPSFSPDGKKMYFASDRDGGFGGFDLYVTHKFDDQWSAPQNLGAVVNSPGHEISPNFNGENLTFASDWHPGFGGFDIFRAEKSSSKYDRVFHLGTGVNSSYDDYGFSYHSGKNIGYFTSNRPGKGAEDLYSANFATSQIEFAVTDAANGAMISTALIDLTGCGLEAYTTDASGRLILESIDGFECNALVSAEGYLPVTQKVSTISGRKNFSIALSNAQEAFAGHVLDKVDGSPLGEVAIVVTNRASGTTSTVMTDANGKYNLTISPATEYLLRFSKAGFLEVNQSINSAKAQSMKTIYLIGTDVAGTVARRTTPPPPPVEAAPAGEPSVEAPLVTEVVTSKTPDAVMIESETTIDLQTAPAGTVISTTIEPEPAPVVTAPAPAATTTTSAPEPAASDEWVGYDGALTTAKGTASVTEGYALQLASVKQMPHKLYEEYQSKLDKQGTLYVKEEGEYIKVRLGPFKDRAAAAKAQKEIKKSGFGKSFILKDVVPVMTPEPKPVSTKTTTTKVKETVKKTTKKATPPPPPPAPKKVVKAAKPAPKKAAPKTVSKSAPKKAKSFAEYEIRLATYKNTKWFEEEKALELGNLIKIKEGGKTIMVLNGFKSNWGVERALKQALEAGFKDAHLFKIGDPKMKKVEK